MVARRGNAPRSAGCKPAALLLSYQAKKKWRPHPVMLRGFLVENQACCYCTMRADENGGAPRTRTLDTDKRCYCFQDSFLDRPDALRSFGNGSPTWARTTTCRLTDGHATLTSSEILVLPAGFSPA